MNEATALPIQRPRRVHFDWILPVLTRPRSAFAEIVAQNRAVWGTPLLLLTATALLVVYFAGPIRTEQAAMGPTEPPEGFQWWSPQQQAAWQQAQQAKQGPVFNYAFPGISGVLSVWVGWLAMSGLVYLFLTLLGGRDGSSSTPNLVAWASLPFAIRDLVQAYAVQSGHKLIVAQGIAGFAPGGEGWMPAVVTGLLIHIDIYGLWFAVLLYFGVRAAGGLRAGRGFLVVLLTLLVALLLVALLAIAGNLLGGIDAIRPYGIL